MSGITFLASSKPFIMPKEIEDYNKGGIFEIDIMGFSVREADKEWIEIINPIFTMPFIYEIGGLGGHYFWVYLEKYMVVGDIIEIYDLPVQNRHENYIAKLLENPEPITMNVGSYTYENQYGIFQMGKKNGLEELKHKILETERGVTTIVKY